MQQDDSGSEPQAKIWRSDPAHRYRCRHAIPQALRQQWVRAHLVGTSRKSSRPLLSESLPNRRVRSYTSPVASATNQVAARVLERLRENFCVLSQVARDPLAWSEFHGEILSDLQEGLSVTELALRQIETITRFQAPPAGIQLLGEAVEVQVDRVLRRMDFLNRLKERLFRLSATLQQIPAGRIPLLDEIEELTSKTIEDVDPRLPLVFMFSDTQQESLNVASHALNVAQLVARLAMAETAWQEEIQLAVSAALLEDSGLMHMPEFVSLSPEMLSDEHRALFHEHPAYSAAIVEEMEDHDPRLVAAVYQHHERLDGSGFPEGLAGGQINSLARLLAIADRCVSIQSPREDREPLGWDETLHEIEKQVTAGKLEQAWAQRLPMEPPHWIRIPTSSPPPSSAVAALSSCAA